MIVLDFNMAMTACLSDCVFEFMAMTACWKLWQ